MKPGNLCKQGAKSGGRRKMRIRYHAHRVFGVRFFMVEDHMDRKEKNNGKKTVYLRMCYQRPSR